MVKGHIANMVGYEAKIEAVVEFEYTIRSPVTPFGEVASRSFALAFHMKGKAMRRHHRIKDL